MNGSMAPSITFCHVGDLQLRAVVVDHRVRLEDVAPDLVAEGHVRLRRIDLRLLGLARLDLALVERVLEHLAARSPCSCAASAACWQLVDDAGRNVREAHRRAGLVDVLSARTRRAEDVHANVLVAHLDVDLLVDIGIDEDRGEARVAPRLRIEGRDADEPVHAGLGAEEAVRVFAFHLEHRALDPRLFALAHVQHFNREAAPLRPPRVHAQQHLRPSPAPRCRRRRR